MFVLWTHRRKRHVRIMSNRNSRGVGMVAFWASPSHIQRRWSGVDLLFVTLWLLMKFMHPVSQTWLMILPSFAPHLVSDIYLEDVEMWSAADGAAYAACKDTQRWIYWHLWISQSKSQRLTKVCGILPIRLEMSWGCRRPHPEMAHLQTSSKSMIRKFS